MENKDKITGRFSEQEDKFIRDNYLNMTDKELAAALNREIIAISNRRKKLNLNNKREQNSIAVPPVLRTSYLSSLTDDQRAEHFRKELINSSMYKEVKKILEKDEQSFYEDKYIDFMLDPTIETMTSMEKDVLHQMLMAEIRIFRYMDEEKKVDKEGRKISRAKEISECQAIIQNSQKSLNVQREQRLKNQNDTAITFTSLIRELKNNDIRRTVGQEAAMLKYIAEKHYNERLGKNIISGNEDKYDIASLFKNNIEPSGLIGNFT